MPPLNVPERFRRGIVLAAELPQSDFDKLIVALQGAPPCDNPKELLDWIALETPSLSDSDRREIIVSIVPMFRVQHNSDVSPEDFARDVWESISNEASHLLTNIAEPLFVSRISSLVEQQSLDLVSSRINDVKREVERSFCKVRVLTDLRPAFAKDLSELPSDMAIIHHFQIGYHDGTSNHKEFYVSLDEGDLKKLKKAVEEAETKASTLERMLGSNGVRVHR